MATGRDTFLRQAHREALMAFEREVATLLHETLSRRLTAYIASIRDAKTVTRWVSGESTEIRDYEAERRLRTAYEITRMLVVEESPRTVRAWFIGLDPNLDDVSPAEAILSGQLKEALVAARAFLATE